MMAHAADLPRCSMDGWYDGMPLSTLSSRAHDAMRPADPDARRRPEAQTGPQPGRDAAETGGEKGRSPALRACCSAKAPQSWTLAESKDFQTARTSAPPSPRKAGWCWLPP